MPALKATETSQLRSENIKKGINSFSWGYHVLAVLLLDILLVYYLMPQKAILCIALSAILWYLTYQDYKYREVDIRFCALFLIVGLFINSETFLLHLYLGLTGFLILHVVHEKMAKVVKSVEKIGGMTYHNPHPGVNIETAPAYIPMFTGALSVILLYYMLGLPVPENIYETVFAPITFIFIPWELWILPFVLACISVYFWHRNKKAMRNGDNIVYYGFGDGDVYFIGAMIGVLGFFLTLLTVFFSMFIAIIMLKRWQTKEVN